MTLSAPHFPDPEATQRRASAADGLPAAAVQDHPVAAGLCVAALYVEKGGAYWNLPGVDCWDEARDARLYDGPWPVVAHPPCQRWGKMWFGQPLTVKLTGVRKVKGDDDGCFAAAIAALREFGGVGEHPWGSHAWAAFGLNIPPREGGWVSSGLFDGGWTCCVEQGRYGHYARKPTMLVVYGVAFEDLPELEWGESEAKLDPAVVERMGMKRAKRLGEVGARGGGTDSAPRIGTPPAFRDLLLSIARTASIPAPSGVACPRTAQTAGGDNGAGGSVHSTADSQAGEAR